MADAETITGEWTFDRDPSPPFLVTSGSGKVDNLDADKVDGYHGSALGALAENETVNGLWSFSNIFGLKTDVINEVTLNAGVTVDGVLLKDNFIALANVPTMDASKITTGTFDVDRLPSTSTLLIGLVLDLPLDEGEESKTYDLTNFKNHGTVYGATWVDGKYGKALSFDGVNDYVEVSHSASLSNFNPITVSAWIYINSLGSWSRWIAKGKYNAAREFAIITDATYNIMKFYILSDGIEKSSGDWDNPPLNTWLHIVGIFTGTSIELWANGIKVKSTDWAGTRDYSTEPLTVAYELESTGYANGVIDEVRIYNRALTEQEVKTLYKDGALMHAVYTNTKSRIEIDRIPTGVVERDKAEILGDAETVSGVWSFSNASGLKTDVINELTSTAGVTIDGVLLKDGALEAIAGIINFRGTMGASSKDPSAVAPDDWIEVKIAGNTYYVPAYLAS